MSEQEKSGRCEDASDVLDAEEEFHRALQTLDISIIMQHWSDSDDVSLLFPGTEAVTGYLAVRDAWRVVAANTREIKLMLEPLSALQCENVGWTFLHGTVMTTHGDETLSVQVYVTNIFRLEENEWKLVHTHSTPAPHQPTFLEQRLN
jgi:ketosteroid isomerase-like protein